MYSITETELSYFCRISTHFRSFQRYFSLVNDTFHSWAIELNARREILYLRAPKYYSLYLADWKLKFSFSQGSIKVCFQASCLIGAVVVMVVVVLCHEKGKWNVKRWSNDLERKAVSIFKNLGVLSKSTHEGSGLFQINHYSVQSANDFVVCIINRG